MKNKGFTLIELLAVIVILAVIALIATPIILNIIDDTREQSSKISIDMYASAMETALLSYEMMNGKSIYGTFSTTDGKKLTNIDTGEQLEIDYNGMSIICGIIEISQEGNIYLSECIVGNSDNEIVPEYGTRPKTCLRATEQTKTTGNVPQGNYSNGDEYICEVKEGTQIHFFVVSKTGTNINLIANRNIAADGTVATESNTSTVPWITESDYMTANPVGDPSRKIVDKGAVTALARLEEYVSTWDNIPGFEYNETIYQYTDDTTGENIGNPYEADWGITNFTGQKKARLLTVAEAHQNGCKSKTDETNHFNNTCPLYLSNYLQHQEGIVTGNKLTGIKGYWLMNGRGLDGGWVVHYDGNLNSKDAVTTNHSGIRPVITLSPSQLG